MTLLSLQGTQNLHLPCLCPGSLLLAEGTYLSLSHPLSQHMLTKHLQGAQRRAGSPSTEGKSSHCILSSYTAVGNSHEVSVHTMVI